MRTAIFLGAGASCAEGAPVQGTLFRDYFSARRKGLGHTSGEMERELATFFSLMFGIDTDHDDLDATLFPTFEEALGILDLAERRREGLKDFDLENMATNGNRIRQVRQYLVMMMADILGLRLKDHGTKHRQLVKKLDRAGRLTSTVFLSSNYDILIDNALTEMYDRVSLDYGVDFANFDERDGWSRPRDPSVCLLKIHGSLNWLYCPACNSLTLTPKEKGINRLLYDFGSAACGECDSVIVPIIVPPTYFKDMTNIYLAQIWHEAEIRLRGVEHIVFCGYSFPDADIHVKYLLKRVQTNRRGPLRISVFNHFDGKKDAVAGEERDRFARFLGRGVDYRQVSFADFAADPIRYI